MTPDVCPNCGTEVPPHAKACPECGSDESTGWVEDAYASKLNLPDEEFDHTKFVKQEFGGEPKPHGVSWFWWIVAVILILSFLFLLLR